MRIFLRIANFSIIDIRICMDKADWNQIRAFQATVEHGSLSSAARQLGLTQPTLSRQVAALEESLGVTLFERVGKRLELTESGRDLIEHARKMTVAADDFQLSASGRSNAVEGVVSISATDGIAMHLIPPALHRIRREAPGISVELVISNSLSDLRRREADIAIRHVRPEDPELTGKLLRKAKACFYASKQWVERNGLPLRPDDAKTADFIGFDREERFANHLRAMGLDVSGANFPVYCDNALIVTELIRQGFGIGVMMREIAQKHTDLIQVLKDLPQIEFPIWLVTHRELHTSRKIRLVFDILAEELGG
jgi:DNA-binding transcriptional LysR family regulator